jgi:predicted kinase
MYKPMNTGPETGNAPRFGSNGKTPDWTLIESQDWVQPMRECPQDPEYHAEGDVWTHTRMVVDALLALPEFGDLDDREQSILLYAALLHDVAKPACTREENGRIVSPGHAKTGEKIARDILWDCDFEFRESVCALVRFHGLPLWGLEKPNPVRAAILAGWRVRNELTCMLAKADVRGRIGTSKDDLMYRLELYRELCADNGCLRQNRLPEGAHSRFRYFWSDDTYPAEVFDDTRFEVVVMAGIAGSGKDTWGKKHCAQLPVVSLDAIRSELRIRPDDRNAQGKVAQLAYERAREYCRRQQSFVWNSTNLSSELRARLIRTLAVYKPRFRIVYLETAQDRLLERRRADIRRSVLERMIGQLDMPVPGEAHEIQLIRN